MLCTSNNHTTNNSIASDSTSQLSIPSNIHAACYNNSCQLISLEANDSLCVLDEFLSLTSSSNSSNSY